MAVKPLDGASYLILSGVHPTIPLGEARAIVEALGGSMKLIDLHSQLLLVEVRGVDPALIAERSGMIREAGAALAVAEAIDEESLVDAAAAAAPALAEALEGRRCFRVRVERLRGFAPSIREGEVGGRIARLVEAYTRVPGSRACSDAEVRVIISEGVAVVGVKLGEYDRRGLEARRPHRKPYYYPGSMDPRLARAIVNLSRLRIGGRYLDPFCGAGGLAVEAGLLGAEPVVCWDLDGRLPYGAAVNLNYYLPGAPWVALQADALNPPVRGEYFDSIATDPPYGRSTSTRGRSARSIYEGFAFRAAELLRRGGWLAAAYPHWLDFPSMLVEAGLKPVERHIMRVHGSLTRLVVAAVKP